MMYLRFAMTALGGAGLVAKLITVGVLVTSLLAVYGFWHHKVYMRGWNGALAAIARQDSRAIADATKLRSAFKTCRDQGRKWDQATGSCS
ncbi:hypothetical protein [uncultured Bradyrhizobium sp.]|uniref:hypothetical protein n=1 Tax=uncultured Bradyrhizobium sp. TaxID=199684 RepID=UPI0035CA1135